MQQDGQHLSIGASLRKGQLYVKVPYSKTVVLVKALEAACEDLLRKTIHWTNASRHQPFVFVGTVEDWKEDLETLSKLGAGSIGIIWEFRFVISLGLGNHPDVDWVARTGGPSPAVVKAPKRSDDGKPDRDVPVDLSSYDAPSGPANPGSK